jgi:hypothetical protein
VHEDDTRLAELGTEAARTATEDTADAIERAAEKNDDPAVGEILDEAALHAETAVVRVSWLQRLIDRLLRR